MTDSELLTKIDAAITAILEGAQEYRLPSGRLVKKADLKELWSMRKEVEARIASDADGGLYVPVVFESEAPGS